MPQPPPSPSTTTPAPERGNGNGHGHGNTKNQAEGEENRSAFKMAIDQMDCIRTSLRDVLGDLGDAISALKAGEKEQRASAKEIQAVRAELKEIQSVAI